MESLDVTKLGYQPKLFKLPTLTFVEYLYFTNKIQCYFYYDTVTAEDFKSYLRMDDMESSEAPGLAVVFDDDYISTFYGGVDINNISDILKLEAGNGVA
jgi:hypothetical protein